MIACVCVTKMAGERHFVLHAIPKVVFGSRYREEEYSC